MWTSFIHTPSPFAEGVPAPSLSLTADDGRWIQIRDGLGDRTQVLLFVHDLSDPTTIAYLRDIDAAAEALGQLSASPIAITHRGPVDLRRLKETGGLTLPVLYDPLAAASRTWRQSRRRPLVRDGVVIVDKDLRIAFHQRDWLPIDALLERLAELEGVALEGLGASAAPVDAAQAALAAVSAAQAGLAQEIDPSAAEALMGQNERPFVLVDVRTRSEFDADHSVHARHLPVDELPKRHSELGQTARIITVCSTGGSSRAAAKFLISIGYTDIYNVTGGMAEWVGPTASTSGE